MVNECQGEGNIIVSQTCNNHCKRVRRITNMQVRRREIEDNMERQFKQGMTAPDWEMDDYGWCASFHKLCTHTAVKLIAWTPQPHTSNL